jgi:hypothetical protein
MLFDFIYRSRRILVRLAFESDYTARTANELLELCELAPWIDSRLVDQLSDLAGSTDD